MTIKRVKLKINKDTGELLMLHKISDSWVNTYTFKQDSTIPQLPTVDNEVIEGVVEAYLIENPPQSSAGLSQAQVLSRGFLKC